MEKISNTIVSHIAQTFYNITPIEDEIVLLDGYSDRNFAIIDIASKKKYALKIVNEADSSNHRLMEIIDDIVSSAYEYSLDSRELSVAKLYKTCNEKLSALVEIEVTNEQGVTRKTWNNVKLFEFLPGLTVVKLIKESSMVDRTSVKHVSWRLGYWKLGHMCGNLTHFLASKKILREELALIRKNFEWQTSTCVDIVRKNADLLLPDKSAKKRIMIERVIDQFKSIQRQFNSLDKSIIHGDLSGNNILINCTGISNDGYVSLIDFQDIQVGPRNVELAILILYSVLEQEFSPFEEALEEIPRTLIDGYLKSNIRPFFRTQELDFIPIIMRLRLCLSLLNGLMAFMKDPTNKYVMDTNKRGWSLLELLLDVKPYNVDEKLIQIWLTKTVE